MMRSKFHHPWQPRIRGDQLFNPFSHTIETELGLGEPDELAESEERTQRFESSDASARAGVSASGGTRH